MWFDQHYFRWYANQYIILVAPPGVVSKSTTASIAMGLLRKVQGVPFGPDVATWQAIIQAFAGAAEMFMLPDGTFVPQSALTFASSELGNLIDPRDPGMMTSLIDLWDCRDSMDKITKTSGNDHIEAPFMNLVACTTPAWIGGAFPQLAIGGGFTSRCIFVYAEEKERLIAYPSTNLPTDMDRQRKQLVEDLTHIATKLIGPFSLTPEAMEYGQYWYAKLHSEPPAGLVGDQFAGYIYRKQTHLHKLAMCLSAARCDDRTISMEDFVLADTMLTDNERDMNEVYSRVGRSANSLSAEKMLKYIQSNGPTTYEQVYRYVHQQFPNARDFEGVFKGMMMSGLLKTVTTSAGLVLEATFK